MTEPLAWPLSIGADGSFATVPQHSDRDIGQCLAAIAGTRVGERADLPFMGTPDPTGDEQPVPTAELQTVCLRHEPRAKVQLLQDPGQLEAHITLAWQRSATSPEE